MKKKTIIPIAFAAAMLFGCASSNDTMDDATAMNETTVSGGVVADETEDVVEATADMVEDLDEGKEEVANEREDVREEVAEAVDAATIKTLVIERDIVVPVATVAVAALPIENPVAIDEMFEDIDETETYSVMDLAKKSPNLSTFVQLIEHAGLEQDIARLNEVTLFAPTNEAFAKMDKQKLEMLLKPENMANLMYVLQAHVLPSKVSSMQFNTTQRIELTEDSYIPVNVTLGGTNVVVGGASIVKDNVEASNGFIHVVDSVILPSEVAVEDAVGN
ncbi:fasciclin domain-containing protein [Pontibacter russatus]|uniref:fasciclin domain-containing protein n=1 Tax=Pontibacter russatus TaxID=2694929 RepID=UPI00137AE74E|nr:fasciclin domain-containing protein [Pontibacter russatus]